MNAACTERSHAAVSADSPICSSHQALAVREKIPRERPIAEPESFSEANRLRRLRRKGVSARSDRSRKGWSPERRTRQAALIRSWAPWQRSTGPKTTAGKARCAMNALKHSGRSQAKIREYQRIRYILRLAARNIEQLRLHIRLRDAGRRIKYKFPPERPRGGRSTRMGGEGAACRNDETVTSRRFRLRSCGTRIAATPFAAVVREEHRWPSASP